MTGKKEGEQIAEEKFVKWFSDLNKDSGNTAGGKGANLSEIYNKGIPVPPGFVVTAQAYNYFIKEAGIKEKIKELLSGISYEETEKLNEATEKIRELITNSEFPQEMKEEIKEAYDHLGADKYDIEEGDALDILNTAKEPVFAAVRSSATTEDLSGASFAGQQESFLNVKGNQDILEKIKECFASLFTSRATYYREKQGFKHEESSIAVVVQRMINSEKSGVIFSKDPNSRNENVVIESVFGLGEGIVSGQITPDKYEVSKALEILDKKIADKKTEITRDSSGQNISKELEGKKSQSQVLNNHQIKRLAEYALELEDHYNQPQDIEFALEKGEIYIVQTRPITTINKEKESKEPEKQEIEEEALLEGLSASEGIAVGKVKIVHTKEDLKKIQEGDILVTEMTNPDMVVAMQKSSAVLTDKGGLTAHAAIVSREMGIPCIVGSGDATSALQDGDKITLDAYNGKVYKGEVAEEEQKEIEPVETETETEIKVINDIPSSAERSAKTNLKKVGLTRLEGIIAESGKHPQYFIENNSPEEYEEVIYKGIKEIGKHFKEMWVRTSDIRSDEYSNLEGAPEEPETNPMLGMHGIRSSIRNPKIFKAELNALKRVSEEEGTKVGLLLPQVINVEEVKETKKALKEIEFENAKVGVMVETPASIQIIKDLCDEGIDFISFGTNDLTQYILAIDRGNEKLQELYDEMHPAIINQMAYVIRVCKRNNVETSICGQAGSHKEMAKLLVEKGIDSISVNADKAKEISEYVSEIEQEVLGKKGQLPRQYEKRKEKEFQKEETSNGDKDESQEKTNPENQEGPVYSRQHEKEDRLRTNESFRPTGFNTQQNEKEDRLRKNDVFPPQEESKNLKEQQPEEFQEKKEDTSESENHSEKAISPEKIDYEEKKASEGIQDSVSEEENEYENEEKTKEEPEETPEDNLLENTDYEKESKDEDNPKFESPL